MGFWTNQGAEPRRAYRWKVVGGPFDTANWQVKKVTLPSYTMTESSHKYLNYTYFYPGRVEWDKVSMTVVDSLDPGAGSSGTLMKALKGMGYDPSEVTVESSGKLISRESATTQVGNLRISALNEAGSVVDTWTLKNAWISSVKFGELDYESDDLVNIDLEFRYDYAEFG